ncbi:ERBB-3 BINDING PROTEIN [Trifolium repens]|nr:ERBB-3 BINDING PROTEIN [Trifolium repens]
MKKPKFPANTKTKKKRNSGNGEETKLNFQLVADIFIFIEMLTSSNWLMTKLKFWNDEETKLNSSSSLVADIHIWRHKSHPLQELQPTKTIDNPEIKTWLALGTCGGKKKKGKKEDKAKAEPGDSTNGATPQE